MITYYFMTHESSRNTLATHLRALAAKVHRDPGVERSDLPPEYRNARKAILSTAGFSDADIEGGKFDHEIHAELVHEISSKYNVSEHRAAKHAHSIRRRIYSRVGHGVVTLSARVLGPAAATASGVLLGKYGTSFLALNTGTLAASAMGILPILLLTGGAIYAGHKASRWTGEALEASRVIREIWKNPSKRDQLRKAVAGNEDLLPIINQLYLQHKTPDSRKYLSTVVLTAIGVGLGTMGAGAASAFGDPGLMGRISLGFARSSESALTYFPKEFFKEGVNLISAPVLNLWKYIVTGFRAP